MSEKSIALQKKEEKKSFTANVKLAIRSNGGIISDIQLGRLRLPSVKFLTDRNIQDIFTKQKESFYNAEYQKLVTSIKNSLSSTGKSVFIAQLDYLLQNENAVFKNTSFNREQTLAAWDEIKKTIQD